MTRKKLGLLAAAGLLVVALTGCVRVTSDLVLHEDNTVSGEIVFAVQEGIGSQMGMSDEEFANSLNEDSDTDAMVNATTTPYNEDGYVGTKITFSDEPIDGFNSVDGTITREGDEFVFEGAAVDQSEMTGAGPDAVISLSLTFPGKVTEHNGTLSGNTVTWDLITQTEAPHARGSAIGGGGSSSAVLLIILALVAAAIVAFVVINKNRKPAAAAEGDAIPKADAPAKGVSGPAPKTKPAAGGAAASTGKAATKPAPKKK